MHANEEISKSLSALFLLLLLLAADESGAKPIIRAKRVSDQRLAELETLLAISKMKEKLVTVPIAFGRVDPQKLGRRRRREVEEGFVESLEEIHQSTEPILINR